jgi:hypothetical protein
MEEQKLRMFEIGLLWKICGRDRNGKIGDYIMKHLDIDGRIILKLIFNK